jgi:hypothetical protein
VTLVIAVVAIVVALASYLTWIAGRLDRVAVRVESAASALDAQLVRRAVVAFDLSAGEGHSALRSASRLALDESATAGDRSAVESELSRALRADPAIAAVDEMAIASRKVVLARQFHNDAVRDLLSLRRRWLVRVLHLYGRARPPVYVEFDADELNG